MYTSQTTSIYLYRSGYQCNRGILHDGDYPHLSTPVTNITEGGKRVILGFNCFSSTVGECCKRAPEHSDAFNRTVRLYQTLAATEREALLPGKHDYIDSATAGEFPRGVPNSSSAAKGKITAQDIMRNPALAKLLVAAAKRVKENSVK